MWKLEENSNANRDSIKMGLRLSPPYPFQFYDVFQASVKIFDYKFRWAEKQDFNISASYLEEMDQLFWALHAAGRSLKALDNDAKVQEYVSLSISKASLELSKSEKIFSSMKVPFQKKN